MELPGQQVCKSQAWPTELLIEPDTTMMQRDLGGHARLNSAAVMGPFALAAAGMPALLLHGLHALASSSPPASEPLGPRHAAGARRWAEDLRGIGAPPGLLVGVPLAALVANVWPVGRGAHTRQAWGGIATQGKARLGEGCACVLAAPQPQPVLLPQGWTARSRWNPAYPPRRVLQPIAAKPGHPPAPRRLAARVGMPELSRASYGHRGAAKTCTRWRQQATSASSCGRLGRLHGARGGHVGKAAGTGRCA